MEATEGIPHLTKIVTYYLNVAYYFLLSPIKITYDNSSGIITVTKCEGIHKVLYIFISAVLHVVLSYYAVISKLIVNKETQKFALNVLTVDDAIAIITNCCWLFLNIIITLELWFAPAKASKMLNKLMAVERRLNTRSNKLRKFKHPAVLVSLIYGFTALTTLCEILLDFVSSVHEPWSVKSCLIYFSAPCENQVMHFGTKFVMILSGIFFSLANALKEHEKTTNDDNEVSGLLRLMLEISLSTKKCFGLTIVGACLAMLPYYASRVRDLFGNSLSYQYLYLHFMVSLILPLYLSAEANSKLNSSLPPYVIRRNCLSPLTAHHVHNGEAEDFRRRNVLLLDVISREGLGLRGTCMTLNYGFFASVMTSILAYSISIMQFQGSGRTRFSYW